MITSIKNSHSNLYKDLFEKASEVLSGYDRTQTFDENKTYFYKDSSTKEFFKLPLEGASKDQKIQNFSNALIQYGQLYVANGKNPADYNFVSGMGITTLEEYYNWLPEIKATIVKDKNGNPLRNEDGNIIQYPTIFTKLPLDEPHFEINLNTRAIAIPAEFKKNGIGVQGDDLAEVVYFMVDRYFDAMDLNNTDIYIEWETPKNKNGEIVKSISDHTLKIIDDENYPGKIIFGWAISDAITQNSGTLKFAVRFVQWNDKKQLVYSFNTLTAQVTIHPNLGLNLENDSYTIDNSNHRLLERIEPSEVVGGAKAAIPYFLKDLIVLPDGYDIVPNHTDGIYELSAVATANDTGAVSYVWKRSEIGKDEWNEIPNENFEIKAIALTAEELAQFNYILPENRNYHLDNGNGGYKSLDKGLYDLNDQNTKNEFYNMFPTLEENELPTIYENRSVLTVKEHGEYKVEARNRIFNSLTKANSKTVVFNKPKAIVFNNANQTIDKHILNTDTAFLTPAIVEEVGDMTYQWFRADEKNVLNQWVKYDNLPEGSAIDYGSDTIRILIPDTSPSYNLQNVGEGGNSNWYYLPLKIYAPEGAISAKRGSCGLNEGKEIPDLEDEMLDINNQEVFGSDDQGTYYVAWQPIAQYENETWKTFVENKTEDDKNVYIGWRTLVVWYDSNGEEISRIFVKTELANPRTYETIAQFTPITEETTEISFIAEQPGLYKMKADRIRNRAETSAESIIYRVTEAPEIPEPADDMWDGLTIVSIRDLVNNSDSLTFKWKPGLNSDGFIVDWYLSREVNKESDLKIASQIINDGNITEISFNPTDLIWKNKFDEAGEDIEGYYYARISNKLNGVYSGYSDKPDMSTMFSVVD